jgi:hypothetical protein
MHSLIAATKTSTASSSQLHLSAINGAYGPDLVRVDCRSLAPIASMDDARVEWCAMRDVKGEP